MPRPTSTILKAAREAKELSQEELAVAAFGSVRHQSLVSRYEAGLVEPSLPNLRKLARVLSLSLGDFDHQDRDYTDVSIPHEGQDDALAAARQEACA